MTLHTLLFGKSKKRMKPIMVDERNKCVNYMLARCAGRTDGKGHSGWHEIIVAPAGATVWRKKSSTVKPPKQGGRGSVEPHNSGGYISKNGYNPHT